MDVGRIGFGVMALLLTSAASGAELTVTVERLKVSGGALKVSLFDTEASWKSNGEMVASESVQVDEDTEVVVFDKLASGTYAIRLMHDENSNGKLDTNLFGIPKEGWGFSNNPRTMGPAKWDQASFELGDKGRAITIIVR